MEGLVNSWVGLRWSLVGLRDGDGWASDGAGGGLRDGGGWTSGPMGRAFVPAGRASEPAWSFGASWEGLRAI